MARHQEAGYSPSTNDNVPQSGEKSSDNLEFRRKRLHRQINPVVVDGNVRDEYADLVQTESNNYNLSHLLSAKVRYGNERFIVGMVIHENNGKFYYDHELIEIKNAENRSLPGTTGVNDESASILNIIQNVLFSTGFDKKIKIILNFAEKDCTGR